MLYPQSPDLEASRKRYHTWKYFHRLVYILSIEILEIFTNGSKCADKILVYEISDDVDIAEPAYWLGLFY